MGHALQAFGVVTCVAPVLLLWSAASYPLGLHAGLCGESSLGRWAAWPLWLCPLRVTLPASPAITLTPRSSPERHPPGLPESRVELGLFRGLFGISGISGTCTAFVVHSVRLLSNLLLLLLLLLGLTETLLCLDHRRRPAGHSELRAELGLLVDSFCGISGTWRASYVFQNYLKFCLDLGPCCPP